MAALLAAQRQHDDPRARDTYHPLTFGCLCGELVRRVDGRSVGVFFADEVAAPLRLDAWIGLPAHVESRVARLRYAAN
jgi:CubicO group peptidase (beta-lactamase class C family)